MCSPLFLLSLSLQGFAILYSKDFDCINWKIAISKHCFPVLKIEQITSLRGLIKYLSIIVTVDSVFCLSYFFGCYSINRRWFLMTICSEIENTKCLI